MSHSIVGRKAVFFQKMFEGLDWGLQNHFLPDLFYPIFFIIKLENIT